MTREENIRAILECNFAGFKDDIIDIAVKRICEIEQEPKQGHWDKDGACPFCGYLQQWDDDNYCGHCGAKLTKINQDINQDEVEQ